MRLLVDQRHYAQPFPVEPFVESVEEVLKIGDKVKVEIIKIGEKGIDLKLLEKVAD